MAVKIPTCWPTISYNPLPLKGGRICDYDRTSFLWLGYQSVNFELIKFRWFGWAWPNQASPSKGLGPSRSQKGSKPKRACGNGQVERSWRWPLGAVSGPCPEPAREQGPQTDNSKELSSSNRWTWQRTPGSRKERASADSFISSSRDPEQRTNSDLSTLSLSVSLYQPYRITASNEAYKLKTIHTQFSHKLLAIHIFAFKNLYWLHHIHSSM